MLVGSIAFVVAQSILSIKIIMVVVVVIDVERRKHYRGGAVATFEDGSSVDLSV